MMMMMMKMVMMIMMFVIIIIIIRPFESDLPLAGGENSKGEALGGQDKQVS